MQLVSEELMEKRMTIDIHMRDCRGSERGHNGKEEEDAGTNGMRKNLTDVEYWKEVAEIREQFNKLKMMIEESQRVGWLMKKCEMETITAEVEAKGDCFIEGRTQSS